MRVVALYKTFDGEEFVEASLASIYEHVDAIVMVHSETSWTGQRGNTAFPVVDLWRYRYDYDDKIRHVHCEVQTQERQYQVGLEYIQEHEPEYDILMTVDADEVWEEEILGRALAEIKQDKDRAPAYETCMRTYIKTPFYRAISKRGRVAPDWGTPVIFLREAAADELLNSARAWEAQGRVLLRSVYFHHFSFVRDSVEKIRRKIESSQAGDDREDIWDLDRWFREKWDGLPTAQFLHPFLGREALWDHVESAWLDELPRAVCNTPRALAPYLPPGELTLGDELHLLDLSKGREHVVDLGTFCGRSAVVLSLGAARVTTVDVFEHILGRRSHRERHGTYAELFKDYRHMAKKVKQWLRLYSNIQVIQSDTGDAADRFSDVDLVFFDADHSYAGLHWDFFSWLPKIRRGGLAVFHDVNDAHPGVKKFVEALPSLAPQMGPYELKGIKHPSSIQVFRKAMM